MGRLQELEACGQAVWLDFLERKFLEQGDLEKLVKDDGLTGVTSNPSLFEKAMGHGEAYDSSLQAFDREHADAEPMARYEHLAVQDIRAAADTLRPVYDRSEARDGYVSLEVSPYLADDTQKTIDEARKLWKAVDRPNLMVKIPGTDAGSAAITAAIADGINVNVTLLFAIDAYKRVAYAYADGLEERLNKGEAIDRIGSVASFFVSRIDGKIDDAIDERVANGDAQADALKSIRGKVAIANAKMAYQWYLDFLKTDRWKALADKGAMPQRLLWASTSTKDPDYPDTLYVDTLIGNNTVNTMPLKTLEAFRDHGKAGQSLTVGIEDARHVLAEAERLGLSLSDVTDTLVQEGVASFSESFDDLLGAIKGKQPAAA